LEGSRRMRIRNILWPVLDRAPCSVALCWRQVERKIAEICSFRLIQFGSVLALALVLVGCAPKLDSTDPGERRDAVDLTTDQELLAKFAIDDTDPDVRRHASRRITDQAVLAKVAIDASDTDIWTGAMERIKDQGLLAKIANEAKGWGPRIEALRRIPGEEEIAKLIASAGFDSGPATESGACVARMKLAALEPHIKSRFPLLQCEGGTSFSNRHPGEQVFERMGQEVSRTPCERYRTNHRVVLRQDGRVIEQQEWWNNDSTCPVDGGSSFDTYNNHSCSVLMKRFLSRKVFTDDDLAALSYSRIPEVRSGAAANLFDRAGIRITGK